MAFTAKIDKIGVKLNQTKLQTNTAAIKTKVGLKSNIREASGSRSQTIEENQEQEERSQVEEGDGNTSVANDRVPTRE